MHSLRSSVLHGQLFRESSDYEITLDELSELHISVVSLIEKAICEYQTSIKHDLLNWEKPTDRAPSFILTLYDF